MPRLGLALSGGGFRATLFHLGVVRFLRDAGALRDVTDIASVSGGSILAAHMVLNWDRYTGDEEQFDEAAKEVVKFVKFDVRNHIVRRLPLLLLLRTGAKLVGAPVRRFTANAVLERYYTRMLYGDRCLYELPEQPRLHVLATSVSTGAMAVFNRDGLFLQQRGRPEEATFEHIAGRMAGLAQVVGASSAFPGFFPPVQFTASDLGARDGEFTAETFTDGGVYDNLGLRAFPWLARRAEPFDHVFVSDAGKPFQIVSDASQGMIAQSIRASDILWDRVWQLERENFGQQPGFRFLPITESVEPSEDPTALPLVVQTEVQSIRTDLDAFSDEEINALAKHGYAIARKFCLGELDAPKEELAGLPPWGPVSRREPTSDTPEVHAGHAHDGPSKSTQTSRRLRKSSRRRVWSTLLDFRDWPSYVYLALAVLLFVVLPWQWYRLYRHAQEQAAIIAAISSGDPDIRQILELVDEDPTDNWTPLPIESRPMATEVDVSGFEVLAHSRIIDLRNWYPEESSPENRGHVYIRDRLSLELLESAENRAVTFRWPTDIENPLFRQTRTDVEAEIHRVDETVNVDGEELTLYEFDFDLTHVPVGEPVEIELEILANFPRRAEAPFRAQAKTDLVNVWMLFPTDRPYRTYELLRYPADRSSAPQRMKPRFQIDHPYGSLIGWSVVDPEPEIVYECRWAYE